MTLRAYKYRYYSSLERARLDARTYGACRKVWNWALGEKERAYREDGVSLSYGDLSAMLTELKKTREWAWLNEVSSVPVQQTLRHLDAAYGAWFKSMKGDRSGRLVGKPRFKSYATAKKSAEYTKSGYRYRNGEIYLAKSSEPLNVVWSRPLPRDAELRTVTTSRDPAGRDWITILVEENTNLLPLTGAMVGVDLGVKTFAVLSDGDEIALPDHIRRKEARLRRYQKRLSRTQKNSHNRVKASRRYARAHAQVADARRDFLHKTTTSLVRDYDVIAIEDLSVPGMTRKPRKKIDPARKNAYLPNQARAKAGLNRAILRSGFGTFRAMLEYKATWYGKHVQPINRWEPSSRLCSECGWKNSELKLSDRTWSCLGCGALHDRDLNAAKNILAAGMVAAGLAEPGEACGADIRPLNRVPLGSVDPCGQLTAAAVKQEIPELEPAVT